MVFEWFTKEFVLYSIDTYFVNFVGLFKRSLESFDQGGRYDDGSS